MMTTTTRRTTVNLQKRTTLFPLPLLQNNIYFYVRLMNFNSTVFSPHQIFQFLSAFPSRSGRVLPFASAPSVPPSSVIKYVCCGAPLYSNRIRPLQLHSSLHYNILCILSKNGCVCFSLVFFLICL